MDERRQRFQRFPPFDLERSFIYPSYKQSLCPKLIYLHHFWLGVFLLPLADSKAHFLRTIYHRGKFFSLLSSRCSRMHVRVDNWAIILISTGWRCRRAVCEVSSVCDSGKTGVIMLPIRSFPVRKEYQSIRSEYINLHVLM